MEAVDDPAVWMGRHLLLDHPHNCTIPSIEEFPSGLFMLEQRLQGALVVHVVVTLYVLCMLAIISNEYFVPAIEKVVLVADIESDVTGAAIMATAASTPQLATAVISVFIAKSDIGVGAVVGSAYFNIFFTIGLCALVSKEAMRLAWWPVFRDLFFYILSGALLAILLQDGEATWSNGLIMVLAYIIYIIILIFNTRLEHVVTVVIRGLQLGCARCRCRRCRRKRDDKECEQCHLVAPNKLPYDDTLKDCTLEGQILNDTKAVPPDYSALGDTHIIEEALTKRVTEDVSQDEETASPKEHVSEKATTSTPTQDGLDLPDPEAEYRSILQRPASIWQTVVWVMLLPALLVIWVLIPDCRRPSTWRYMFVLTIAISVVIIGLLAYVLVWMVAIIGSTIGIPDTIMGLTFLAAGASLPDLMNALIVTMHGYGEMAVSNCIGSNIFDVLVCLGLPWLLDVLFERRAVPLTLHDDVSSVSIWLVASAFLLFTFLFISGWRLTRVLGGLIILSYVVFVTSTAMFTIKTSRPVCTSVM